MTQEPHSKTADTDSEIPQGIDPEVVAVDLPSSFEKRVIEIQPEFVYKLDEIGKLLKKIVARRGFRGLNAHFWQGLFRGIGFFFGVSFVGAIALSVVLFSLGQLVDLPVVGTKIKAWLDLIELSLKQVTNRP